ncbi:hypothetical protein KJ742_00040 [Patescibacteria group bacterium]|nr:hypothetical protein [Patescibacteria group bacterium]
MPEFYDQENCRGVKITIIPNNRWFKNNLKKYSRSVAVGEAMDLTLRLEKLDDFDSHFWENRRVISQLPERNKEYAAEINWGDDITLEKMMVSIRTDCTGEIYYRMPKVIHGFYDLNDDDTVPLYYSKVVDKTEIRREIFIGISMLLIGAVLTCFINCLF